MGRSMAFSFVLLLSLCLQLGSAAVDYKLALSKAILYFEAQRSGKLPSDQRAQWRADSGLRDGGDAGVDLVGGYYDAGDNVKFGFPMAFTVTMLAWSVVKGGSHLKAVGELPHALAAVRWGADYLIKAHPQPDVLYAEVGDGDSDHSCWERPEDMSTPRTAYRVDSSHPGSDIAGETAAAMAAAAIAFRSSDAAYSDELISHAKQLFDFAVKHTGSYSDSLPVAKNFYSSSGYADELLWAAAWLHRATDEQSYLDYIAQSGNTGGTRWMFSWDDKFAGVQALVARLILEKKVPAGGVWAQYKDALDQFVCSCVQKGQNNVKMTPGGVLWWMPWNNLQYVTASMFIVASYSDYLAAGNANLQCSGGTLSPKELIAFARSQVDYILGANPKGMSYMVGFGNNYPQQVHHRGASIVSIKENSAPVSCQGGYNEWYNRNSPNPNTIEGAIVGGPDAGDGYSDARSNYVQSEPATANNAPLVGLLAVLAAGDNLIIIPSP
ncbi:hypothetical protein Taro_002827 [Colocasia esculenta]|uniref:Endoglucanase n=1 Tax=Colocasia esculenta TaxID=4460 RepID=A0A843THL8_COLES|nr:hypothetical protein [Colocasia esculenta]